MMRGLSDSRHRLEIMATLRQACAGCLCLLAVGCSTAPASVQNMDLLPGPPDLGGADLLASGDLAFSESSFGSLMPQVVQLDPSRSVLTSPTVVAITWDNDTNRSAIEAFYPDYAASSSWATQVGEYGVGALAVSAPQHVTGNAPTAPTDSDIQSLLRANLGASWGAPNPQAIYALFFPSGSIVDDGTGAKCCTDFDGYHADVVVAGVDVVYSVACSCPGFDGAGVSDIDQITVAAAHETVEAATDPYYNNPGWAQTDDAHAVWTFATDGEVADLCEFVDTAIWTPPDMTHAIQRTWSNRAAAAGHDPCVGQPTEPYYQTIPDQNDPITIDINALAAWRTKGTKIAQTGTLTLRVYADGAAGPFIVGVDDYSSVWSSGPKLLDVSVPSTHVMPGDTITATVTVMAGDSTLGGKAEAFVVNTKPVSGGGPTTYYFGLVGQ
jgi:hypothetical protein